MLPIPRRSHAAHRNLPVAPPAQLRDPRHHAARRRAQRDGAAGGGGAAQARAGARPGRGRGAAGKEAVACLGRAGVPAVHCAAALACGRQTRCWAALKPAPQILESEGRRQATINVAEAAKSEVILRSEGARQDQINRAQGGRPIQGGCGRAGAGQGGAGGWQARRDRSDRVQGERALRKGCRCWPVGSARRLPRRERRRSGRLLQRQPCLAGPSPPRPPRPRLAPHTARRQARRPRSWRGPRPRRAASGCWRRRSRRRAAPRRCRSRWRSST